MKNTISTFFTAISMPLLLVSCSIQSVYPRYKDYDKEDYSIISVYNFITTTISFFQKDLSRNCLVKERSPYLLVLNELLLPKDKKPLMSNTPLKKDDKYMQEYKIKSGEYVEIVYVSNNVYYPDQVFNILTKEKAYYYPKSYSSVSKLFYFMPDKNGIYKTDNKEFAAQKWDIDLCDK